MLQRVLDNKFQNSSFFIFFFYNSVYVQTISHKLEWTSIISWQGIQLTPFLTNAALPIKLKQIFSFDLFGNENMFVSMFVSLCDLHIQ